LNIKSPSTLQIYVTPTLRQLAECGVLF
jgi:hypothetical protein